MNELSILPNKADCFPIHLISKLSLVPESIMCMFLEKLIALFFKVKSVM